MKLLVSDYDGTLKPDIKNLMVNIEAINEFRKKGNHFSIATGRDYYSIKKEIDKYNIKYDYLITNDGALTLDGNDNVLSAEIIEEEIIKELRKILNDKYKNFNEFKIPNTDTIIELQLITNLFDSLDEIKSLVSSDSSMKISKLYKLFLKFIFIKKYCNKSTAIKKIENNYSEIITVGDNLNDLEMLRDYNGYKMLYSYPIMYTKNIKTTTNVHSLIKKL